MKKQKITGKLALKKYDFAELGNDEMNNVKGGAEAGFTSIGFKCSQKNSCKRLRERTLCNSGTGKTLAAEETPIGV